MAQFRPSVFYLKKEHSNSPVKNESLRMKSYSEIKKEMPRMLKESYDDVVRVYRSRRGEWGEWFEHWGYDSKGKPCITKQGWQ